MSSSLQVKACCASLYHSDVARLLLGESLHPGGAALTHRLGRMAGIKPGVRVLDVACGTGASARNLARSFKCQVIGLDLDRENLKRAAATGQEGEGRVSVLLGDGEALPFGEGAFDVVFCECSMSLFPDKQVAAQAIARCLRPGGSVALSDVTVEPGALPSELDGSIGQMLCMADALPAQGYPQVLADAGLQNLEKFDATSSVVSLVEDIKGKLSGLRALEALRGQASGGSSLLSMALPLLDQMLKLAH